MRTAGGLELLNELRKLDKKYFVALQYQDIPKKSQYNCKRHFGKGGIFENAYAIFCDMPNVDEKSKEMLKGFKNGKQGEIIIVGLAEAIDPESCKDTKYLFTEREAREIMDMIDVTLTRKYHVHALDENFHYVTTKICEGEVIESQSYCFFKEEDINNVLLDCFKKVIIPASFK